MKKIFLYIAISSVLIQSCKREDEITTNEVDITTQNTLDDQAILHFMDTNYLDALGVIKPFSDTDTSDDNYPKLSDLQPIKLENGTYYIMRPSAQPNPGAEIKANSVIRMMSKSLTYKASKTSQGGRFGDASIFQSGLDTGEISIDPLYFFAPQSVIDTYNAANSSSHTKSFFEIEGLSEALQKFRAFDKSDDENYNLQGVIIVPSRAAFARDPHYRYTSNSLRDANFVFNFQVYKSVDR